MENDDEKPVRVSLDGLDLRSALGGLLTIPDPDKTKPKHEKAKRKKKAPPTGKG